VAQDTIETLLARALGVRVITRPSAPGLTVGVASAQVLRQNPNRVGFTFVNLSANTIYLAPGREASSTYGILVGANGGAVGVTWFEDFTLCAYDWQAIATAAASAYLVIELLTAPEPA
jgi:hypothetical protein